MSGKRNAIFPAASKITIELESVDVPDGPSVKVVHETSTDEEERSQKPSPLLDAVEIGDASALTRQLLKVRDVNYLVYGPLRVTLLHIAAFHHPHLVHILLKHGAIANTLDAVGRSPLHLACTAANSPECIQALIDAGANVNQPILLPLQMWTPHNSKKPGGHSKTKQLVHNHLPGKSSPKLKESAMLNVEYPKTGIGSKLPVPECLGRTGLHQTVKAAQPECVKILLKAGAVVDSKDQKGLTPLLLAGAGVSPDDQESLQRYEAVVWLLVDAGADVNILNPDTGTSALHHAAARCSFNATQLLVRRGATVDKISATGATVIHEAAHSGALQVLLYLLDNVDGMGLVNKPDHIGMTPLHKAAFSGNRGCLEVLLQKGGHLASLTHSGTSVLDAVIMHVARPYHFLASILDSCVQTNNISVLDRAFKVHLDFSILAPHGCERQTAVLRQIFNAPNGLGQKLLLRHPLLETFLWLKWRKLRIFFFVLLLIYGSFLFSLTIYAVVDTELSGESGESEAQIKKWSGRMLMVTSILLLTHISIQALLRPLFYVREIETWIFAFCGSMSLVIVCSEKKGFLGDRDFTTHIMAYVLLLAWTELMLLIGRFPTWGNYALMFYTVLRNVLKVMLTFVFIVIGFTLSFYVQFSKSESFKNPWKAFVKTIVMMAGEFDYQDIFAVNSTAKPDASELLLPELTGRIIFLIFVIVTTIVMMNLMVGLAVSDIQAVQAEGHFRRLLKQAQFVDHLETIISHPIFTKFLPKCIIYFLTQRRRVITELTLQPSAVEKKHRYPLKLPRRLIETCVELAVRQRAINQLRMDEALMDTDVSTRFSWLDLREEQSSGNLCGFKQQAVLEDMMLRVFEELQELKNLVQTSCNTASTMAAAAAMPRTLSRKESRRLNLPRGSGVSDSRSSRLEDAACEVQGAHCMFRRFRDT